MRNRLVFVLMIFLMACQSQKKEGQKDVITVSILPQKYFIERIAGDLADVNVLIPPGASPATYSLLPSQLKDLTQSRAWFRMKHIGFELSWYDKILNTNPDIDVFVMSEGIDLIAAHEEEHDNHVHMEGVDPHFWMAPQEVSIIAENTLKALIKLYPDKKEMFEKNFQVLSKDISEVDEYIKEVLTDVENTNFLVFHPALTYFAREYGLTQLAIENMGKEPSPKHVKEVVKFARDNKIKVIFIQKEFDRENAEIIAQEINGEVIQINPLNYDWIEQMKETTVNLKNALN